MERATRKSCRTQLTKMITAAREKLQDQEEEVAEFMVIRDRLIKANEGLEQANENMAAVLEEREFEDECDKVLQYRDNVTEMLSRLQIRIDEASQDAKSSKEGENRTEISQHRPIKSNVKLPNLELRKFNGDLAEWTLFWEQFRTEVHENETVNVVSKFHYLEQSLTGKAAATISGLTASEKSYNDAIDMLKHEYGNQQRIIDSHIQKLLSITPVKSRFDSVGLRSLFNTASSITRNLTALGVDANQYGMMAKSVILNNIPHALKIEYRKQHPNDDKEAKAIGKQVETLLKLIKLEVEALEISQSPSTSTAAASATGASSANKYEKRLKLESHKSKDSRKEFTAAGLLTTVNNGCLFCASHDHATEKCNKGNITLQQKKDILRKNNCCFRCARPNHSSKYCRNKVACEKCNSRHVTSMCDPNYKKVEQKPGEVTSVATNTATIVNEQVYLQTAKAYILTTDKNNPTVFVRLILDGGFQLTYIKEDVSRKLNLKILGTRKLSVMPFGCEQRTAPKLYNKVELKLISQYDDQTIIITAVEVPEICYDSFQTPNVNHQMINSMNMADVSIGGTSTLSGISVLIGADNYWKVATGEFLRLTENLTAINTKLGWTLQGPNTESSTTVSTTLVSTLHVQINERNDNFALKQFWDLETIGINDKETQSEITAEFIEKNIAKRNDRFEVSLPWKNNCPIDSNYESTVSRLNRLIFKLSKESKLIEYDNVIREFMTNNIAEEVPPDCKAPKTYYMPHRPVYREDKATSKVRVVFDASAHAPGLPSLNDLLHAGENLVQDLMKVLLNFRVGSIAIIADIEKAFLQISLCETDRDCHRFLWFKHPITDLNALPPIQEFRMTRVTFGVTSSPFLLSASLRKLLLSSRRNIAKHLKDFRILSTLTI